MNSRIVERRTAGARRLVSSSKRVRVDAVAVELVPVGADPAVHDLRRHLGVELEAEAPSDDVGLRAHLGVGDQLRARRQGEGVEVPLEPRAFGMSSGSFGPHRQPADLRAVGAERLAAEHARHELAAKAEAEDGYVVFCGLSHQLRLAVDERNRVVEGCELRAERRDELVVARVGHLFLEVDPKDVDVCVLLVEPLTQQAGRRRLLVLDDQGFQLRCRHHTGLGSSFVSSSFATCRTEAAKRSTISASSASVLVNGGANSVWSPANPSRVGIVE